MLERIFLKPQTVDRIMGCWLGKNIEVYAAKLYETGYSVRSILRRTPILVQFADFTDALQIHDLAQAECAIDPFVDHWLSSHCVGTPTILQQRERSLARHTVRHFYSLTVWKSEYQKRKAPLADPFVAEAPGFFTYLREERGLRSETLYQYRHHLRRFAAYLDQTGCADLRLLSLPIVTGFITTTAQDVSYSVMVGLASSVRVFLRYLRRERLLDRDISKLVEIPQRYRLADIPRSISWEAVQKVLDQPDRRTVVGRRDFAMLLLMATYGLRAREVAALTLDDIDWPVTTRLRRPGQTRPPYIFDLPTAQMLVDIAARLPDNNKGLLRGPSYATIFSLLFGLGLRVSEVARLRCRDVDQERSILTIRDTKFSKSRLVPMGPQLARRVVTFLAMRAERAGRLLADDPVFSFTGGRAVNPSTISQTFHKLIPKLGLSIAEGERPPTAHHLRHSFAVGRLLRWYRDDGNPTANLMKLSTFMGHVDPTSTAIYLTITAQLLDAAARRFERFAAPLSRGGKP